MKTYVATLDAKSCQPVASAMVNDMVGASCSWLLPFAKIYCSGGGGRGDGLRKGMVVRHRLTPKP